MCVEVMETVFMEVSIRTLDICLDDGWEIKVHVMDDRISFPLGGVGCDACHGAKKISAIMGEQKFPHLTDSCPLRRYRMLLVL